MNLEDIIERISIFKDSVKKIISTPNVDYEAISTLVEQYEEIIEDLVLIDSIPESVRSYILSNNPHTIKLPKDYEGLKFCQKLQKYIYKHTLKKLQNSIKNNYFNDSVTYLTEAIAVDVKNTLLISKIEKLFYNARLTIDLMEVYKIAFFYTLNPAYIEKLGDIHFLLKEYNESLDDYLNVAELTDNNSKIYKKLAKVFTQLKDFESKATCLAQAKLIEDGNGV